MGYDVANNVRKHSQHNGNPYLVLLELAIAVDDFDRTVTRYMDTLAAYCHMELWTLQRAVRQLESSGELIVYDAPGWRQAPIFQVRVLPVEWPDCYRLNRQLLDRRNRPVWTPELDEQRDAIHRANEAVIRKQRATNRAARRGSK